MINQWKFSFRTSRFAPLYSIILLLLGASVPLASADTAVSAPGGSWLLAKYDSNGDKIISADEISYKRERVFEHMDADADGAVSISEYQERDTRRREMLLQARFAKLDLNGDGRLTADEYSSYLGSFDRLDSDGDGQVTPEEMTDTRASVASADSYTDNDSTHCLLWFCVRTEF